jgi:hypothetical protein
MADRVTLSLWLRGYTELNMLHSFERVLRRFPFSRLSEGGGRITIYAVDYSEAPIAERIFAEDFSWQEVLAFCQGFTHADCAYELETWWDLWASADDDWELRPAKVTLTCYGPAFPSELGEQLRIDLGFEDQYLPPETDAPSLRATQSNIRSVLHLAEDLGKSLPIEKRLLWSEEGENLAERLQAAVGVV